MANLETLELTINGSAEQASQGIDSLISRLSSLSKEITKPYSDLRDFNSALKETAKLAKSINFGNIGKSVGSMTARGASKKTVDQIRAWQQANEANRTYTNATGAANMIPEDQMRKLRPEWYRSNEERKQITLARNEALRAQEAAQGEAKAQQSVAEAIQGSTQAVNEQQSAMSKIKQGFGNMTKGASSFFSKVKRIATTMLIRAAIRGLIRDMKEGVNNLYEWSKLNNGEFAKSFDTLKAKGQQLKNSLGAAIAPVIQAAIPVLNALTNAAITAFNWVNQLIALLSGQNYWTKATDNVDAYTDSVNKAGGAAKEWLASFDELNVMTSGGGGGGGGASGITSDMFENTTRFDSALKDIVGFIKDNFEDVKLIAGEIGVAILAWKLSQGFAETLPALSKLAGLIGVGAVIAIQLQASYLLTDKYLKTGQEGWLIASALTTAIGAAAAGTIAKKIFGGKIASATIGFALIANAVTDIVANVQNTDVKAFSKEGLLTSISAALKAGAGAGILLYGIGGMTGFPLLAAAGGAAALTFLLSTGLKLITANNNIKWGNIKLTEAQIDAFVTDQMFEANPKVIINLIADNIEYGKIEREKIQGDLIQMMGTYDVIRLGIDMSNSYSMLMDQANALINDVHEYVLNAQETGKLTLQFTPSLVGNTPEEQAAWYTGYSAGWDIVDKFYEQKGKEIGNLFVENEKGQIELKNPELLQTIMSSINEVTNAITESNIVSKATSKMKLGLGDLTEATGESVITVFKQYKTDLEKAYEDLVTEQYVKQGELVAALAAIDSNSAEYKEAVAEYERMGKNLAQAVQEGVQSKIQPGVDMITEWLGLHGNISNWAGIDYWVNLLEEEGFTADMFNMAIKQTMLNNGYKEVVDVADLIGFTGWTFLSNDLKKKFLEHIKIDDKTIKELAKAGVPATELVELVNWDRVKGMTQDDFIKTMTGAFGAEGIAAIKHRFPDIKASQVVKFSDWASFTNAEKLNFINAIGDAFGASEAVQAAKNAGIDLEKAVKEGMNSQNEDIRKMAQKWAELMGIEIRGGNYTVEPKYSDNSVSKIPDKIKNTINSQDYLVYVTTKFNNGSPQNIKDGIDNLNGKSVPIRVTFENGYGPVQSIEKALENFTPKAKVEAELTNGTTLKNQLKKALSTTITLNTGNQMLFKMQLNAKAGGGLVSSGDMFIANENGVPEMIGRFGNQTGVANTEQIVTGISRGVAQANSEQNALLREQNNLLRMIYENGNSGGLPGANSALGRQIKRSLDAYNGLVGG